MVKIDPEHYRKALREAREANDDIPELPKEVRHISKEALKGKSISAEEFNQLRQAEKRRGIKFYKVVERKKLRSGKSGKAMISRCAVGQRLRAKYDGMPTIVVSHSDTNVSDNDVDTEAE